VLLFLQLLGEQGLAVCPAVDEPAEPPRAAEAEPADELSEAQTPQVRRTLAHQRF
jgi:hypothetical protein